MKRAVIHNFETPDYSGTESINTICTNLSFSGRNLKKVVITSCAASDGKSYISLQIMNNLARRGKRVLLIDADLRRSALVQRYGIETNGEWIGLAHFLAGYNKLDDIVYETNIYGAYIIPIGRHITNPIPLIDTADFAKLLDSLAEKFDMVLVDAPPIGLVIDAAEIAKSCDGILFVVEYKKTKRSELAEAKWQMEQAEKPILGCVLNNVTFDSLSAKKYYNKTYYSYYGNEYNTRSNRSKRRQDKKR